MSVPLVKQAAWISLLPQLLVLSLFIALTHRLLQPITLDSSMPIGAIFYFAYVVAVRNLLARPHRRGIRLVKAGRFAEAIPQFEASYQFFTRRLWIDRWRYLTLLSSSAMSYREMALCNIAFCYGQIGEGAQSKIYYQRALQEFPNSGLATAALNIILAAQNAPDMQNPLQE